MSKCFGCRSYSHKVGVLVAQLGTPEAPTAKALRPYLKQFLSDERVIEFNRPAWWLILNGIILNTRPAQSARKYARIWRKDGSPLLKITEDQTKKLDERIPNALVRFGMRYGSPSIESVLEQMIEEGCNRIVLLPMYPQYAAATSASVYDAVFPQLLKHRWVPTVRVVEPFFDHPLYVEALAQTINEDLEAHPQTERLVLSYHGVPKRYIKNGDPYCCMCVHTTELLKTKVKLPPIHTYQSRFGREPWLEPYTDEKIRALAESGVKRIAVSCPGFTTDCLETLDEIGNEAREDFEKHGGEELRLIPCLNSDSRFIDCLETVVRDTAGTWLDDLDRASVLCRMDCPAGAAA